MLEKAQNNQDELREYLLGNLNLQSEAEKIEERLMTDEKYFEEFLWQEEELIQEYADGELTPDERKAFEKHFLISDERREKLMFARALHTYVDSGESAEKSAAPEPEKEKGGFLAILKSLFSSPVPIAAAGLIIVSLSALVWYFYFSISEAQKAMTLLAQASGVERPLEARITNLGYAPFYKERSLPPEENANLGKINHAELILRNEIEHEQRRSSENLHALGRVLLAKKQFKEAVAELEKARELSPQDASVYNDLGVAYLESYEISGNSAENKNSELAMQALGHFEKAIELSPRQPDAYFNRAVCLKALNLSNEAREAWKKYLEIDSTSPWADEARRNLETLASGVYGDIEARELEDAFLLAFREKSDEEAIRLSSRNRELIKENYLPQRLAISLLDSAAPAERSEKLAALRYLGNLEKERIGDNFASDLADFYAAASEDKINLLKEAQAAVRRGYRLCLDENKFRAALEQFELARSLFLQAGDVIEAQTVAEYFIAYCFYNLDERLVADRMLKRINDFSEQKGYRWFALMNYYWWLGSQEYLGHKSITETRNEYEIALEKARKMGDFYMTQKFLLSLLLKSHTVKQEKKTFFYLHKLLELSSQPNLSIRQKFRAFDKIIQISAASRFPDFSKAVVQESVAFARVLTDPSFSVGAEINAGIVSTQAQNYEQAEEWFLKARQKAENLPEESARAANLTKIFLNLGHLERKRKNFREAVDYYRSAQELAEKNNSPSILYEIRKARLLAFRALEDDEAVERELAATMQLVEDYRKRITAEQDRITFFDNEQAVYNLAIEHEIRRNRPENAYAYAENSASRSLLDWLEKGSEISASYFQNTEVDFKESAIPLDIHQIREAMPPEVQILQFRVLDDKVLIWLISKEHFSLFSSEIKAGELEEKIILYLKLIQSKNPENRKQIADISRELYKLLIAPALPFLDKSKRICLIPNKILFRLPFATLAAPSEDGKYFLEDFDFFYSPSANVFIQCTRNAQIKREIGEEKLLSVGNPAFDRQQFPNLAILSESKAEALEIKRNYSHKSEALVESDATKNAFLGAYKNFEVIHFAGHYIVDTDAPQLSKMVMAKAAENSNESSLTNIELRGEKLPQTRLVVLSACETGAEGHYSSEGIIGISRTFLAAGVPLVVSSAWRVESEATRSLMKKFHYYRREKNLPTHQALRQAQMDMLNAPDEKYKSVYFWGAFSAFGGYAEF